MISPFTRERTLMNRRPERSFLLLLLVLLLQILSVSAIYGEPGEKPSDAEKPTLVIAYSKKVFYNVDINDAIASTKIWAEMLVKRDKIFGKSETVIFSNLPSLRKALSAKAVDILIMPPEEFLTIRNSDPIDPVFVADVGKYFYFQYILLVRTDSGIGTLGELRDRKLIIASGQSGEIPSLWIDTLLMKEGLGEMNSFFAGVREVQKPSESVLPVFFRQADAAIANRSSYETMTELNPQLRRELKIMAVSQDFSGTVISLRRDFYVKHKDIILKSLESLHNDPQGKQILTLFRTNRLLPYKPSYIENVEALLRERRNLKGRIFKR
jgi:ABC-type phosphate/phosphonate transport system substrate-binding protein